MPFKSEEQRRAMYAAAAGKSTIGIPEEVGKKFVAHRNDEHVRAAGIMIQAADTGRVLLVKRSDMSEHHPGEWAFPAGKIEDGENPLGAAIRECEEEVKYVNRYSAAHAPVAVQVSDGVEFHAYHQVIPEEFTPEINDESSDAGWFHPHLPPAPMLPNAHQLLKHRFGEPTRQDAKDASSINELDVMKAIRDGSLPSPQRFGGVYLFDIRISGTGFAERSGGEIAHRPPQYYLSEEFLERCQGLPVIMEHPSDSALLDTESFRDQSIGTVVLPYVKGDEVWGVARIYDEDAANVMSKYQLSTSPAVTLGKDSFKTGDVLLEGSPRYLDHVAVCPVGVWDKAGPPTGIRSDSLINEVNMDENKKTEVGTADLLDVLKDLGTKMDSFGARLDSLEAKKDAAHDAPHNKVEDSKKADEKDKEEDDCKDAKADKLHEVEGIEHCKEDSKADDKTDPEARADAMKIADLEARLARFESLHKEPTLEERNEIAAIQSRADSLAMALGETAGGVRPLAGETPFAFRKRAVSNFTKFSKSFKGANISGIADEAILKGIEDKVYADAAEYAKAPPAMAGVLREVKERVNGREMSSFVGDPSTWMDQFSNGVRYTGRFRQSNAH